jgi:hypothetical protein
MKTKFTLLFYLLLLSYNTMAQVLPVTKVTQEQTEWCWAGVSKSLLALYQHSVSQCEIAEYTRTSAVWHNYGTQPCCDVPNGACNYWNYPFLTPGSIQDIILHFKSIASVDVFDSIKLSEINTEISNFKPFVIRWLWNGTSSGHFVIGHGVQNKMIYYMDPYPGEGSKIANYDWIRANAQHTWTHTLKITTAAQVLTVSKDSLHFDAEPQSNLTIDIFSNLNWTVSSNQEWLSADIQNGSGIATLTLLALSNKGSNNREAQITIAANGVSSKIIKVLQAENTATSVSNPATNSLTLYPNPVSETVHLTRLPKQSVISIHDASGKLILSKVAQHASVEINVSGLLKGIYTITVRNEKDFRSGLLIIK